MKKTQQQNKLLIITIGTSLYTSASWNFAGWMPKAYPEWTPFYGLPSSRATSENATTIKEDLSTKILNSENNVTHFLQALVDPALGSEMRYSAEIATTLLYVQSIDHGKFWKENLSEYKVVLFCDEGNNDSRAIAKHTKAYLEKWMTDFSGWEVDLEPINDFSATEPGSLTGAMREYSAACEKYVNMLGAEWAELVFNISGGYKIYGIHPARLLKKDKVIAIYLHESSKSNKVYEIGLDHNDQPAAYEPSRYNRDFK